MANKKKYKLTQKEYAEKYNRSVACIKKWYAEGLPLDDEEKMEYILIRKNKKTPVGKRDKVIVKREIQKAKKEIAEISTSTEEVGAAAALKRLEKKEREVYLSMLEAEADNDFMKATVFEDKWLKCLQSLRYYDKDVDQSRRQADELQKQCESVLETMGVIVRFSLNTWVNNDAKKIAGANRPEQIKQLFLDGMRSGFITNFESGSKFKAGIPPWTVNALKKGLEIED